MRIAVFTSNQPRHVALIEALAGVADEVFAVQECCTAFPGRVADFFRRSPVMQDYFERVIEAERTVFGGPRFAPAGVRTLSLRMGDLSHVPLDALGPALEADCFVVFGASYIRGPLCDRLVQGGAVNLHMGVSPYYRGSSCNFWALRDGRADLVGATIHRLTAGLDSGPILFHALPPVAPWDAFELGMRAVEAGQAALVGAIRRGELANIAPVPQDRGAEIRYTRNADFTDEVAAAYLERVPTPRQVAARLASRDRRLFVSVSGGDAKDSAGASGAVRARNGNAACLPL